MTDTATWLETGQDLELTWVRTFSLPGAPQVTRPLAGHPGRPDTLEPNRVSITLHWERRTGRWTVEDVEVLGVNTFDNHHDSFRLPKPTERPAWLNDLADRALADINTRAEAITETQHSAPAGGPR